MLKAREYIIRTVVELKDAEVRAGDCFFIIIIIIISLVVLCNSLNQEHIYLDKNSNFKNSLPPFGQRIWILRTTCSLSSIFNREMLGKGKTNDGSSEGAQCGPWTSSVINAESQAPPLAAGSETLGPGGFDTEEEEEIFLYPSWFFQLV